VDTLDLHVYSSGFDRECMLYSKGIGQDSDDSSSGYSLDIWEKSPVESPYDVSKLEAHLYYSVSGDPVARDPS
jgi:hypothetical protein